ncbi:MAG: hypothetical protein KME64_38980 [Scytonematopsis contorta HA4267-MV1]|jgi:hypothetical protein|nr:hypothetical protein [Scytonematopsis contorta HA4267-MV1]
MTNESPKYPKGDAIKRLTEMFKLTGYCQDWEIEVANPHRVSEFCDAYETIICDSEDRFALMCLIIASYDEYLRFCTYTGVNRDPNLKERIYRLICEDFSLHKHTVEYWCDADITDEEDDWENPEWVFAVTPMMRDIWALFKTQ